MADTTDIQTSDMTTSKAIGATGSGPQYERRASVRRVSLEQEKADYAAWLREYRRWTQTGCAAPARTGEIEWGAEDGGRSH